MTMSHFIARMQLQDILDKLVATLSNGDSRNWSFVTQSSWRWIRKSRSNINEKGKLILSILVMSPCALTSFLLLLFLPSVCKAKKSSHQRENPHFPLLFAMETERGNEERKRHGDMRPTEANRHGDIHSQNKEYEDEDKEDGGNVSFSFSLFTHLIYIQAPVHAYHNSLRCLPPCLSAPSRFVS